MSLETTTIIVLLSIAILLLFWIVNLLRRISAQLRQSSPVAANAPQSLPEQPLTKSSDAEANTDFDRFLAEDPQRKLLTKKEQAAAYRVWRKQQGLTWSA